MEPFAVAVRWLQLAAASLLVGGYACALLVARPAARAAGLECPRALGPLDRGLGALGAWALAITLASGLLDLWRQTTVATGLGLRESLAPAAVGPVLLGTRYGAVWLARHGLLALLGVILLVAEPARDTRDWLALRLQALALAAASLGLLGAASHAASAQWAPGASIAVDAVHLLATGVWAGALVPFALTLRWSRSLPPEAGRVVAAVATRRFSALGLAGVICLVLTGLDNAWVQVGGVPSLVGTPYGRWLLLKLALVLALLAAAALNRLVLTRRLLVAARDAAEGAPVVHRLRRQVLAEAALAAAILGVVAVLGLTVPARHVSVTWPFPFRLSWEATRALPGVQTRVAIGSQIALLGFVAALLAVLVPARRWRWTLGAGAAALALGLAVALPALAVDAYPTTYLRPAVPYAAASIAEGLALYRAHCAPCHGAGGRGDGPAGAGLRPRPADLTAQHTADHTVGDIFWWLTHGIPGAAMHGLADRLDADARWDVINLLRTLAAAEQARALGPDARPRAWLVAPDFAYSRGVGDTRALKDYRGARVVVLVFFTLPASADRLSRLQAFYPALLQAGAEVIGIPMTRARRVYRDLGDRLVAFPIAVDGAGEAATTYGLFGRDPTPAGGAPGSAPPHVEFLIDRQGYARARWIPPGGDGWADPTRLLAEVARLAAETPEAGAPDEHVH
ncbi:MAG: CopD family protein [Candidatus Rokubacteria bacterium]|nr:CopD family protein [Candidatus Rokubacteria bacterium]